MRFRAASRDGQLASDPESGGSVTSGPRDEPAGKLSDHPGRVLTGIMLKVMSVAVFVGMQTCIKAAGTLPAGQIVFFRSFFAIFPIIVFLAFRRKLGTAFATKRPLNHIARGVVGVCAMGLGFFALTRLPLPEAITLNYAQPLLVVVFSSLFLGEAIRVYRWSAVAVGLVGVLIISWPELTLLTSGAALGDQEVLGVIAALVAAAISANRHPAGAQSRPDRTDGDHRAVVFGDGERHGAVYAAFRLAGADAAAGRVC